jgi:hypothetical protein
VVIAVKISCLVASSSNTFLISIPLVVVTVEMSSQMMEENLPGIIDVLVASVQTQQKLLLAPILFPVKKYSITTSHNLV